MVFGQPIHHLVEGHNAGRTGIEGGQASDELGADGDDEEVGELLPHEARGHARHLPSTGEAAFRNKSSWCRLKPLPPRTRAYEHTSRDCRDDTSRFHATCATRL